MKSKHAHLFVLLRIPALLVCFLGLAVSITPAYAGGAFDTTSGVAIWGYDPVAYFTMEKAVKGKEEFNHEWLGATWHFTSLEHRDLFFADPIKYAPQHGGFCSAAILNGNSYAEADPLAWRIVDGKLYLFYDKRTKSRWKSNRSTVAKTDEEWLNTLLELTQ